MAINRHIQHIKSQVVENGAPKLPTSSQIQLGEIAINYAKDHETIAIKNASGEIVTFSSDVASEKLIETTYSNLKTLRDGGKLKKGAWYRITDYTTTTVQTNTRSAGHQFDVIVRADSNNVLNENAYAAIHSGDTYFANSKLNAWEIKYTLDNDVSIFEWADSTNGKGVIYYMKDEHYNECPYDFKNIQYKLYKTTDTNNVFTGYWCIDTVDQPFPSTVTIDETDYIWAYTFYYNDGGTIEDTSVTVGALSVDGGISRNSIKPCIGYNSIFRLNGIVFKDNFATYGNQFKQNCSFCVFGEMFMENTFGNDCYYITFGITCYANTFGNYCYSNTFGNYCYNNTFGNYCYSNTFGNDCKNNTFGNSCSYNTFGNGCVNNTFGNDCNSNTFGNNWSFNTFGNDCNYNTFGNYCYSNTFGNSCNSNTFGKAYTQYIIVENGNKNITLTSTQTTSGSAMLQNIKICQGVNNRATVKTISHNTVGDTFQTEYKPINSNTVTI